MYSGAFWIPMGMREASATAPKKRIRSSSLADFTGGGCSTAQAAPASAARFTLSIWPPTVLSDTVTLTGTRPAAASRVHRAWSRRSSTVSLLHSLASPPTARPWTPPAMQASTWASLAPRSSVPSAANRA